MAIEHLGPEYKDLAEACAFREQHDDEHGHNPISDVVAQQQASPPDLPPVQQWPDNPIIVRSAMPATHFMTERVNMGPPMPISTDLFEGQAKLWVAGLPSTPPGMFDGVKRKTMLVVQGKFRAPLHFNDVLTGQDYPGPLQRVPASALVNTILAISRKLNPSMEIGTVKKPSMLAPVIATAQAINVAEPGSEQPLHAPPAEDLRLLGLEFTTKSGEPLSGEKRKHTMAHNNAARNHTYTTEHVYSFWFWQHFLSLNDFKLHLPLVTLDAPKYIGMMPVALLAQTRSGSDLWRWHVWHQRQI